MSTNRFGVSLPQDDGFDPMAIYNSFKEMKMNKIVGSIIFKILIPTFLFMYLGPAMLPEANRLFGPVTEWWLRVTGIVGVGAAMIYHTYKAYKEFVHTTPLLYLKSDDDRYSYFEQMIYFMIHSVLHYWGLVNSVCTTYGGHGTHAAVGNLTSILSMVYWTSFGIYRLQSARRNRIVEVDSFIFWFTRVIMWCEFALVLLNLFSFPTVIVAQGFMIALYLMGTLLALLGAKTRVQHLGFFGVVMVLHAFIQFLTAFRSTSDVTIRLLNIIGGAASSASAGSSVASTSNLSLLPSGMLVTVAWICLLKDCILRETESSSHVRNYPTEDSDIVSSTIPSSKTGKGKITKTRSEQLEEARQLREKKIKAEQVGTLTPALANTGLLFGSLAFYYSQHNGWYLFLFTCAFFSVAVDAIICLNSSNGDVAKLAKAARSKVGAWWGGN